MLYNNILLSVMCFPMNSQVVRHEHDHQLCIDHALSQAEKLCKERGVRLTSLRLRVLSLIWQSHKPLGAYDILNILTVEDGHNAAPPTVYRALDFLLENHLIHRLASRNSFVGCSHPTQEHEGYFFICSQCNNVLELEQTSINQAIEKAANEAKFMVATQTVEVLGVCHSCRGSEQ